MTLHPLGSARGRKLQDVKQGDGCGCLLGALFPSSSFVMRVLVIVLELSHTHEGRCSERRRPVARHGRLGCAHCPWFLVSGVLVTSGGGGWRVEGGAGRRGWEEPRLHPFFRTLWSLPRRRGWPWPGPYLLYALFPYGLHSA